MAPRRLTAIILWVFIASELGGCAFFVFSPDQEAPVPSTPQKELSLLLANPEIVILDARKNPNWKLARWKTRGALRENPETGMEQ